MKQTVSVQQTDHDRDQEGGLLGLPSDGAMERRATLRGKTERRRLNVE